MLTESIDRFQFNETAVQSNAETVELRKKTIG
jgi:hypothetical protein